MGCNRAAPGGLASGECAYVSLQPEQRTEPPRASRPERKPPWGCEERLPGLTALWTSNYLAANTFRAQEGGGEEPKVLLGQERENTSADRARLE